MGQKKTSRKLKQMRPMIFYINAITTLKGKKERTNLSTFEQRI